LIEAVQIKRKPTGVSGGKILTGRPDVVVIGAGVMGCSAAYWLSKEGCKVLVLEKEAVAVGASGMASAHWSGLGLDLWRALEDGRLAELAWRSFQLHQELASVLPQESGRRRSNA
jgi:glycine/D-amino acid oxidase-like deaminating enzyme